MFNDRFGLTKAVLEGRKTMTRRSIPKKLLESIELYAHGNEEELHHRLLANSSYRVGEVVAIAQSYNDVPKNKDVMEGNAHYIETKHQEIVGNDTIRYSTYEIKWKEE